MAVFPSLYQAKAVQVNGSRLRAFIPQVFGDQSVNITRCVGSFPTDTGMGWVAFQGGNPSFPVWMGVGVVVEGGAAPSVTVADEVWIGPTPPVDDATELWYDTDEPDVPVVPSWKMQSFNYPVSQALVTGGVCGVSPLTSGTGDSLCDLITMPRPSGWVGPTTVTSLAFRATGLYAIEGNLSFATSSAGETGCGFMNLYLRSGAALTAGLVRGWPGGNMPFFYNTYVGYRVSALEVMSTDVALVFGVVIPANLSTWTSPGTVWVKKLA